MLTRKSIDTVLLSVGAEKLSQTRMGLDENAQTHGPTTCDGDDLHPEAPWRYSSPYPATGYRV